jgi:hypothetical protein
VSSDELALLRCRARLVARRCAGCYTIERGTTLAQLIAVAYRRCPASG